MNHLGSGGFAHLAQPNICGHQLVLLILKQKQQTTVFGAITRVGHSLVIQMNVVDAAVTELDE